MNKSEYLLIEQKVLEIITQNFSGRPKFVVGVSGGADSMALLFILRQLDISTFVVHINYGLRGTESDKDQELVEGISFEWGFECCSVRINSEEAKQENFQNWARKERYRIFLELVEETKADGLAIAHHKDDQVETIIQKLFRGSSPEAWSGMSVWDNRIFRPLLEFSKTDILNYCKENAIPFRTDSSNLESSYARNFLRNDFSEKLNELFPGWQENMLGVQEFGKLNELTLTELSSHYFKETVLDINAVKKLDRILAQAILKKFIEQFAQTISKGIIEEAYHLMESQTGAKLRISDSVTLIKDRNQLCAKEDVSEFKEYTITKKMVFQGFYADGISLSVGEEAVSELYLDLEYVQFPVILRRWKSGDKIQPLGMSGTQKISDHLTNQKVSTINREKSLVLCDTGGTIYAIIFEGKENRSGTISEISKATDSTKHYLLVTTKKQA